MRAVTYSDDDYIAGVQRGDEAIFTAFVHTYLPVLTRFSYGFTGNEDAAHDIVQEVFARIWQLGPDWRPFTNIAAYLFTAVRNRALNSVKAAQASERLQDALREQIDPPLGDNEAYADIALIALIRRESQRLTERQQTALRLRFEQGMTTSQVASVLGVEPKAAEKLFARAFAALRTRLERIRDEFE